MKKSSLELPEKIFGLDTALMVIFIKPIGLILILLVVFNLVVLPRIGEAQETYSLIQSVGAKEKNYLQKINYLKSIDQESLQRDENLVTSSLLPEKNSYYLVNVIRKIADKYGYMVDSFSVRLGELEVGKGVKTETKGYVPIPVSLVMVGPSGNYFDLALGLERSLPILKLSTFDMKNTSGVSTIQLQADGFYLSDKKLVESDKLTLADLTLKQEENELVSQLSQYQILDDASGLGGIFSKQKEFVKYQRLDPFSQ